MYKKYHYRQPPVESALTVRYRSRQSAAVAITVHVAIIIMRILQIILDYANAADYIESKGECSPKILIGIPET